jgi:hypothetical protein
VPGVCHDGNSTAVRIPSRPAGMIAGEGMGRSGFRAWDSMTEVLFTVTATPQLSRVRLATTVVPPATAAVCTPGLAATSARPSGP